MANLAVPKCSVCKSSPAAFQCSCQSPFVPLCLPCNATHALTSGSHHISPRVYVPIGNSICDQCQGAEATYFCSCAVPFKKHCDQCGLSHYQKRTGVHFKHPIEALEAAQEIPAADFRKKQLFIEALNSKYEANLLTLDQLIATAGSDFNRLIRRCEESRDLCLQQLQGLREQVRAKVREATTTIQAKRYLDFHPTSELESFILSGWTQGAVSLPPLFHAALDLEPAFTALKACQLETQFDIELENLDIPVFSSSSVRLYSLTPLRMRQITLLQQTQINVQTAYCYISPTAVLCCGGFPDLDLVTEIDVTTGAVTIKQSMTCIRRYTGVFKHQGYVYAIGGYNTAPLATAEKFQLTANTWKLLTGQLTQPRHAMTPCVFNSKAYIAGYANSIEVLDFNTELFTPLSFSFKAREWSVSFIVDGILLIIHNRELWQWTIDSPETSFRCSAINNSDCIWSNCPPVRIGRSIYFVFNPKGSPSPIAKLDLDVQRLEILDEVTD